MANTMSDSDDDASEAPATKIKTNSIDATFRFTVTVPEGTGEAEVEIVAKNHVSAEHGIEPDYIIVDKNEDYLGALFIDDGMEQYDVVVVGDGPVVEN